MVAHGPTIVSTRYDTIMVLKLKNFRYDCGHNNSLKVLNADGLLGFDRGSISIITQTAQSYDLVFSYCLPSKPSIIGYLELGNYATHVQYTPMITSQMSVFGAPGTMLSSGRKAILDSGTVISGLSPITYSDIHNIF
ncbi:hypothetical protein IEQ34_015453 [Dendrobium chrysotoxum]|uniref:Xylanase inhibitor N-terminal domain-containing protein n=1 Tax=Dendrobium chrysotoxum TaxID=161865 RepID=A0AAV7GH52_DENCH|nr:hypothetical protein IEQ34_015453 [Dendrobium chrysotoxum]